jgi:hypothetical protein
MPPWRVFGQASDRRTGRAASLRSARTTHATTPGTSIHGLVIGNRVVIGEFSPAMAPIGAVAPAGAGFRVVALDASGRPTAGASMATDDAHVDRGRNHPGTDIMFLSARLPGHPHGLEITRARAVPAKIVRSGHPATVHAVRVRSAVKPRSRARKKTALVSWTTSGGGRTRSLQ